MSERRDVLGSVVGLITFLVGVGLIIGTFVLARDLFITPPAVALDVKPDAPLNVNETARALLKILVRILLLLVMAIIGGIVATRGIRLYAAGAPSGPAPLPPSGKKKRPEPTGDEE